MKASQSVAICIVAIDAIVIVNIRLSRGLVVDFSTNVGGTLLVVRVTPPPPSATISPWAGDRPDYHLGAPGAFSLDVQNLVPPHRRRRYPAPTIAGEYRVEVIGEVRYGTLQEER